MASFSLVELNIGLRPKQTFLLMCMDLGIADVSLALSFERGWKTMHQRKHLAWHISAMQISCLSFSFSFSKLSQKISGKASAMPGQEGGLSRPPSVRIRFVFCYCLQGLSRGRCGSQSLPGEPCRNLPSAWLSGTCSQAHHTEFKHEEKRPHFKTMQRKDLPSPMSQISQSSSDEHKTLSP